MSDWTPDLRWPAQDIEDAFGAGTPEQIFYLILQISRRRDHALAVALQPLGISVSKWRALSVIRRLKSCPMNDLSQLSAVDRTTLTRTVDQMVAEGLVRRTATPSDRRRVLLELTPAGADMIQRALEINRGVNAEMLKAVPQAQREIALGVLQSIVEVMVPERRTAWSVLTLRHPEGEGPPD